MQTDITNTAFGVGFIFLCSYKELRLVFLLLLKHWMSLNVPTEHYFILLLYVFLTGANIFSLPESKWWFSLIAYFVHVQEFLLDCYNKNDYYVLLSNTEWNFRNVQTHTSTKPMIKRKSQLLICMWCL